MIVRMINNTERELTAYMIPIQPDVDPIIVKSGDYCDIGTYNQQIYGKFYVSMILQGFSMSLAKEDTEEKVVVKEVIKEVAKPKRAKKTATPAVEEEVGETVE